MNTPSIRVSRIRNAIMYSLTRIFTSQQAAITSGIRKVVSITNRIEMPSTPILYCRPSSQSRSSTNWKPVFCGSKPNRMNSDTKNVITVAAIATHLALRCASLSSPRRKRARIPAASNGMKVTIERRLSISYTLPTG